MSYGSLYKMSYYDFFGQHVEVYVKQLDFAGDVTEVIGGEDPLRVSMSGESSEKFQYIRGTSVEIDFVSTTDFQFIGLHTSDFKQYKVEIYKDTVLDWTGWLLPDYYQEPYLEPPYTVTIHAADGLGLLKNYELVRSNGTILSGRLLLMDILNDIFLKIGTGLDLWENINIYEDNMNSTAADSVLRQTFLNSEIFYDIEGNPMNCYDALVEILKPFNAYVTQTKGCWHIIRVPTNKSSYTRRKFTWASGAGAFIYDSNESHDPQISTTKNIALATLARFVGNTLTVSPPWKEFTIVQYYGPKESIINNGDFSYDTFVYASAQWWTQHWVRIGSTDYEPFPTNKNYTIYVFGRDIVGENVLVSPHPYIANYRNLKPLNPWPNNEYCVKITGTNALIANAYGIENSEIDLVLSATDSLLFHFEFLTNASDVDIYLQISIVGDTTKYMSSDGTWGDAEAYISISDNPENQWITKEIQSNLIEIDGELRIRLYETVGGAESDFVKWDNIRVGYLPANINAAKELRLVTPVNSNNIYIPSEIELLIGDMPNHDNNALLYSNGLYYSTNTPTSAWTDGNTSISDTLVNSMAAAIKVENNKPYQVISGTIYSKLIDFATIIRETNNNNYLFMLNSATIHDKAGAWDVEMIQFAETYDLLAEDASTLVTEAGDQLITE